MITKESLGVRVVIECDVKSSPDCAGFTSTDFSNADSDELEVSTMRAARDEGWAHFEFAGEIKSACFACVHHVLGGVLAAQNQEVTND